MALQSPIITVRWANPRFNSLTRRYTLDAEFSSSIPGVEISGMNVRFFYDSNKLLPSSVGVYNANIVELQGHYKLHAPNPPLVTNSLTGGKALFNLAGAATYFNGAISVDKDLPNDILLDSTWKKLFAVEFRVPTGISGPFAPSVIWDLEQDNSRGGYLPGSAGVVIVMEGNIESNELSYPATENVSNFNWDYNGSLFPPYGTPNNLNSIMI